MVSKSTSSSSPGETPVDMQALLANAFPAYSTTSLTSASPAIPQPQLASSRSENRAHFNFDEWSTAPKGSHSTQDQPLTIASVDLSVDRAGVFATTVTTDCSRVPNASRHYATSNSVHPPHTAVVSNAAPTPLYHPQPTRSGRIPVQPPEEELEAMLAMDNYFEFPSEDDSADEDFVPPLSAINDEETPQWANVEKELGLDLDLDGFTSETDIGLEEGGLKWLMSYADKGLSTANGNDADAEGSSPSKDADNSSAIVSASQKVSFEENSDAKDTTDAFPSTSRATISSIPGHGQRPTPTDTKASPASFSISPSFGQALSAPPSLAVLDQLEPGQALGKARGKRKMVGGPKNSNSTTPAAFGTPSVTSTRNGRSLRSCRVKQDLRKEDQAEEREYLPNQELDDEGCYSSGRQHKRLYASERIGDGSYTDEQDQNQRPHRGLSHPGSTSSVLSITSRKVSNVNPVRKGVTSGLVEAPNTRTAIPPLSPASQAEIRKQRNKEQSKTFRERKKARLEETVDKVETLEAENSDLKGEVAYLKKRLDEMEKEREIGKEMERRGIKAAGHFSLEDLGKVMAVFMKNSLPANATDTSEKNQQQQARASHESSTAGLAAMIDMFAQTAK
ncbi:MAG: hypothetical protein CYPHOPRED_005004 [Cyphobasidiales sp. Tagirdzhanova-0007]|nr:MAG: hypothetical protein CYPHOPRED_005004 [Cyphobasidiales sp. Tagirdzhanova-0007]